MSNKVNITITSELPAGTLAEYFSNAGHEVSLAKMKHFLQGMMGGQFAASIATKVNGGNGVAASKTITLTSCLTGDKLLINDVAFEAGVEWALGVSDSAAATNLAEAINASEDTLVDGIVTAEADGSDVIITAVDESAAGNSVTLQSIGSDGISIPGEGDAATATLTCATVVANDTAIINGVTLTAVDKKEKTQMTCVADTGAFEVSTVTCVADTGAFEEVVVNVPSTAAATQADYFVLSNTAAATAAFWIDIDDNGTEPTGAAYVAANSKIRIDVATGGTATQNATILQAAAASILNWDAVDNLDGTVTYTQTEVGNCTNAAKHNENDTGDGSFTFSGEVNGAASNLNSSYFTFSALNTSGTETDYYVWYNVNGEGVDPAVGGATAIPVAIAAGATDNDVASATRTEITSVAGALVTVTGATNQAIITGDFVGDATDVADGGAATGFTLVPTSGAASNLNSSYFTFFNAANVTKYYMWYNVNGQGVDPAVASATGVEVALSASAVANTVASSSRAKFALSPLSTHFTESGATDKILFRNKAVGTTTDAADGAAATGFTVSVQVQGGSVGASQFQIGDTDALSATALTTLVNATATLNTIVLAETDTADVIITALEDGVEGNNITLSATGGISASGTRLSGGTDDNITRLTGGVTVSDEVSLNFGV